MHIHICSNRFQGSYFGKSHGKKPYGETNPQKKKKSNRETTPTKKIIREEILLQKINQAIHEEVENLLQAGFTREVDYPE
jgi:hypothetical protein